MNCKKLNNFLALVLALVLTVGLLPVQASAATADFTDVSPNAWYYSNVMWARQNGIVDGVGNNRFEPEGHVANNAMVKMIVSAFFSGEYAAYEVQNRNAISAYFGEALSWDSSMNYYAKRNGLLDGVNMDIGKPTSASADMSRYDMAMLLYNAATKKGLTASAAEIAKAQTALLESNEYWNLGAYKDAVLVCYGMKKESADRMQQYINGLKTG